MSLILDSNGITVKWTGNTVPNPYFIQANPRNLSAGNEWFAIANNHTSKWIIQNYAQNLEYGINYFIPPNALQPIPFDNIVTSLMTDLSYIFSRVTTFNQPIGSWDTSKVTNMSDMFSNDEAFNQPIGSWNTSNVIDMSYMFFRALAFNKPIGSWNTSNVTNMQLMFARAAVFNQTIGSWNTLNVQNMRYMFHNALNFNNDENVSISSWNTSNVTNMDYMFAEALVFNQNISYWNVNRLTTQPDNFSTNSLLSVQPVWGSLGTPTISDILLSNTTVSENVIVNTVIGNLSVLSNQSNVAIYTLITNPLNTFSINGSTLTTASLLNYTVRSIYNIEIQAISGGISLTKSFTIAVSQILPVITNILLSNKTIAENVPMNTVIGSLSVLSNISNLPIYTLITNPLNTFSINGSTLTTATLLNYTVFSIYNIEIQATVGGISLIKPFTISITNIPQAITINIPQAPISIEIINGIIENIPEDSPQGTFLGELFTVNYNKTNYFIYQFVSGSGSADNTLFILKNNKLYTNTLFNYITKNIYSIRLKSTDSYNRSIQQIFILKIVIPYSPNLHITTMVGKEKSFELTGNAVSVKQLTYEIVIHPTNGFLTHSILSDKYTYIANRNGTDFLIYVIHEGTMVSLPIRMNIYNYYQSDVDNIPRNQGTFIFNNISFDGNKWRFGTFETDTFIQAGNDSQMGNFYFDN